MCSAANNSDKLGGARGGKSNTTKLAEATSINRSLSALGNVIHALTSGAKHVPYRDHTLTKLMSDSLGGNAKTMMVVNISPASENLQETRSSLSFALRVKKVSNKSTKNKESSEIRRLREKLAGLQGKMSPK